MFQMQNPPDRQSYRWFLVSLLVVLSSLGYLSSRFSSQATLAQTSKSAHVKQTGQTSKTAAYPMYGTAGSSLPTSTEVTRGRAKEVYGRLPLSFVPNRDQTDSQVQFLARGSG